LPKLINVTLIIITVYSIYLGLSFFWDDYVRLLKVLTTFLEFNLIPKSIIFYAKNYDMIEMSLKILSYLRPVELLLMMPLAFSVLRTFILQKNHADFNSYVIIFVVIFMPLILVSWLFIMFVKSFSDYAIRLYSIMEGIKTMFLYISLRKAFVSKEADIRLRQNKPLDSVFRIAVSLLLILLIIGYSAQYVYNVYISLHPVSAAGFGYYRKEIVETVNFYILYSISTYAKFSELKLVASWRYVNALYGFRGIVPEFFSSDIFQLLSASKSPLLIIFSNLHKDLPEITPEFVEPPIEEHTWIALLSYCNVIYSSGLGTMLYAR